MKLLLTSAGIKNASVRDALVELLAKPIDESSALCIPTALYAHRPRRPLPVAARDRLGGRERREHGPDTSVGDEFVSWHSPTGDRTLGVVDFSIYPHLDNPDLPDNTMANAERWAPWHWKLLAP